MTFPTAWPPSTRPMDARRAPGEDGLGVRGSLRDCEILKFGALPHTVAMEDRAMNGR